MIEEYKSITGFEGLYQISNFGNVKSFISNKILKPSFIKGSNSRNYGAYCVTLYKNNKKHRKYVHVIVCEEFISSRPEGMQVRHLDSDTSNNTLSNLCWGTPQENCNDQIISGTRAYGEEHGQSKLTEEQVKTIKRAYLLTDCNPKRGWYTRMGGYYGVTNKTIINITRGITWGWLNA